LSASVVGSLLAIGIAILPLLGAKPIKDSDIREDISILSQNLEARQLKDRAGAGAFDWSMHGPGGPQVWTTAQVLTALLTLPPKQQPPLSTDVPEALSYIDSHRIEGGWGYQDGAAPAITEIDAWVVIARALALRPSAGVSPIAADQRQTQLANLSRDVDTLLERQFKDGAWGPFEADGLPGHERTYSTLMGLWALVEARPSLGADAQARADAAVRRAKDWLMQNLHREQNGFVGWTIGPQSSNRARPIAGLTAQGLFVLQRAERDLPAIGDEEQLREIRKAFLKLGLNGLKTSDGEVSPPLRGRLMDVNDQAGDSDRYLRDDPKKRALELNTFLWYPWTLAAVVEMAGDKHLERTERRDAFVLGRALTSRYKKAVDFANQHEIAYPTAETLYALSLYIRKPIDKGVRQGQAKAK